MIYNANQDRKTMKLILCADCTQ